MLISTRPDDGDGLLVQVHGDLDNTVVVSQLRQALVAVMRHRTTDHIVLDLAQVSDIDGIGIGTVVAGCDALGDVGISVLVRGPATTMHRLRAGGLPEACAQLLVPAGYGVRAS